MSTDLREQVARVGGRVDTSGFTLVELMVVVTVVGVLAAVAIPAFMKNSRKAKTAEALVNVKRLADGAMAYRQEDRRQAGTVVPIPPQFPNTPSTSTVPALGVCCTPPATGKCEPDPTAWNNLDWQALHFSMDHPHYYSYRYVRNAAGAAGIATPDIGGAGTVADYFYADAMGDLNCNGQYSTFEMFGAVGTSGEVTHGGIY